MLMLIQGIWCKWKMKKPLITEFLVMTALKYNHNSLLLIRASHLVLLLLFVVSIAPWVHITLPRQTQREAQKLLHKQILLDVSRVEPMHTSAPLLVPTGLSTWTFLLFGGVGLPYTLSCTGNFPCSPIHQQKKFSLLLHREKVIKENCLGFIYV